MTNSLDPDETPNIQAVCIWHLVVFGGQRFKNEREEFMQETQHTQQPATRTAQNQDKKIA